VIHCVANTHTASGSTANTVILTAPC
jgi:hypothetical protein